MNLTLPQEFDEFVQKLVSDGRYGSVEDAVAAGIRLLQTQESLRAEIAKGVAQLEAGDSCDEDDVFAEAEAMIAKIESERQ